MKFRKPSIRIGKKGKMSFNPGSMRIGGKAGLNVSKSGVSGSLRTGKGLSYNTKRGMRARCLPILCLFLCVPVAIVWLWAISV